MSRITVDQLAALDSPVLIDVREPDEYAAGHAPSAVNLPMSQLDARVDEVPTDAPVHVICQSGGRSARATEAPRPVASTRSTSRAARARGSRPATPSTAPDRGRVVGGAP